MKTHDDKKAVKAVDEALKTQDNLITLSSGVVLRGKKANPLTLIQVMASFQRPTPPLVYMKAMGREVENPDDPNYLEDVQAWKMAYSNAMVTAMIVLGTELESKPRGMPGPDDNAWIEEYSLLVNDIHPENKTWRYLTWVKFKAMTDEADMAKVQEVVGALSGVRESSVSAAEDFPGRDTEGR